MVIQKKLWKCYVSSCNEADLWLFLIIPNVEGWEARLCVRNALKGGR